MRSLVVIKMVPVSFFPCLIFLLPLPQVLKKDNWVRQNADAWIAHRILLENNKTLQVHAPLARLDERSAASVSNDTQAPHTPHPSYLIPLAQNLGINEYGDVGKVWRDRQRCLPCHDGPVPHPAPSASPLSLRLADQTANVPLPQLSGRLHQPLLLHELPALRPADQRVSPAVPLPLREFLHHVRVRAEPVAVRQDQMVQRLLPRAPLGGPRVGQPHLPAGLLPRPGAAGPPGYGLPPSRPGSPTPSPIAYNRPQVRLARRGGKRQMQQARALQVALHPPTHVFPILY